MEHQLGNNFTLGSNSVLKERENPDLIFLLETDKDEESLKSLEIMGCITLIGRAGEFDGKVRILALISKSIPFKFREDLSSPDVTQMWIEIERKAQKHFSCWSV